MRVRTGRFEKLRSGEFRDPQAVEVGDREHTVQRQCAVMPPASCLASDAGRIGIDSMQHEEVRTAGHLYRQMTQHDEHISIREQPISPAVHFRTRQTP